jgi:hypothetical protein
MKSQALQIEFKSSKGFSIDKIYPLLCLILISSLFLSTELQLLLFIFYFVIKIFHSYLTKKVTMPLFLPLLFSLLVFQLIVGVVFQNTNQASNRDLFRDIYYYLSPLITIGLGAYLYKVDQKSKKLVNSLIFSGTILSIVFIIKILISGSLFLSTNILSWRQKTGYGSYDVTIALCLLLCHYYIKNSFSKGMNTFSLILCLIATAITFTRTHVFIVLIFTLITIFWKIKKSRNKQKEIYLFLFVLFLIFLFLLFMPNSVVSSLVSKLLNSFKEMSFVGNWNDAAYVTNNWRGFELHQAIKMWESGTIFNKLFGYGFGSKIYIGSYSSLLGLDETSIPVLHNGYGTMLIKGGLIGIAIYLLYFIALIFRSNSILNSNLINETNKIDAKICIALSIILIFMSFFAAGLFKDSFSFPFCLLLGCMSESVKKNQKIALRKNNTKLVICCCLKNEK